MSTVRTTLVEFSVIKEYAQLLSCFSAEVPVSVKYQPGGPIVTAPAEFLAALGF